MSQNHVASYHSSVSTIREAIGRDHVDASAPRSARGTSGQAEALDVKPAGAGPTRWRPCDPFFAEADPRIRTADPGSFPHKQDSGWRLKTARVSDEQMRFNPILHEINVYARRDNGKIERISARPPRSEAEFREIANPQRPGRRKGINEFNELLQPNSKPDHQAYQVALAKGGVRAFHKQRGMCSQACEGIAKNPGRPKPFEHAEMRPRVSKPTTPRASTPALEQRRPHSAGAAPAKAIQRPMSAAPAQTSQRPMSARLNAAARGTSSAPAPRTPRGYLPPKPQKPTPQRTPR
eukprot:gnl/MRDRNA2_/MRDRNA2_28886_c0_seq1.p1 gnl/MRDRNA2_/MRDRNA2_28886_c0~~gnl/MRDRNA2_/MRDRNA2_28886_c0_seq1.p1  ORF type:complete len:308 (+),score=34.12 gnl/MRDRNA2_/MRDRNA2_28886_c0_seq1:46-924(+)